MKQVRVDATVKGSICSSIELLCGIKVTNFDIWYPTVSSVLTNSTIGSHFAMVRFTIHFYNRCPVGPSTPDLWCVTVTTQASFLYLVHFQLSSGVHMFLLFLF